MKLWTTTEKVTQSYDINILWPIEFSVGYEWLIFILASITALAAIRSFQASRRQNQLSTIPHLVLEKRSREGRGDRLYLVSHNKKFAYQIVIESVHIRYTDIRTYEDVTFHHDGRNYVSEKEPDLLLTIQSTIDGRDDQDMNTYFLTHFYEFRRGLVVRFRDSQRVSYFTLLDFKDGETTILRSPTKLSIFWQMRLLIERDLLPWVSRVYWKQVYKLHPAWRYLHSKYQRLRERWFKS